MKSANLFFGILILIAAAAAAGGYFYLDGWRLQGFTPVRTGSIELSHVPAEAEIFVNDRKKLETGPGGESTVSLPGIAPGRHTIIVGREGHRPWVKILEVESEGTTRANTFTVPRDWQGEFIKEGDEHYAEATEALASRSLPTAGKPLISRDGAVEIWSQDGAIYARFVGDNEDDRPLFFCSTGESCRNEVLAFAAEQEIRDLAFFGERNDVAIMAVQNGIYAVGLDRRAVQNVLPILEQRRPIFAPVGGGERALYVSDAGALARLSY